MIEEMKLIQDHEDVQRIDETAEWMMNKKDEDRQEQNNDDIQISPFIGISAVRKREGVMPKQKFC